jgi:RimJ/RimL family protein N-acetyltransferase
MASDRLAAPIVESERLRLRGHRRGDLEACATLWGDPEVTRYIAPRAFTREEVWTRLLRYVGHWQVMGYGFWVIEEKTTGRFLGELGFADFKRDIEPRLDAPEAGWVLTPAARGEGYASEALTAALAWSDAGRTWPRIACIIDPANARSIALAGRCGFRPAGIATHGAKTVSLFFRPSAA